VTFEDSSSADKVLSQQLTLDGRRLEIKVAIPKGMVGVDTSFVGGKPKKIFVAGIANNVTEAELKNHFATFGRVVECYIQKYRMTGESRGFGFVSFETPESVEKALLKPNQKIGDKCTVDIKIARPKGEVVEPPSFGSLISPSNGMGMGASMYGKSASLYGGQYGLGGGDGWDELTALRQYYGYGRTTPSSTHASTGADTTGTGVTGYPQGYEQSAYGAYGAYGAYSPYGTGQSPYGAYGQTAYGQTAYGQTAYDTSSLGAYSHYAPQPTSLDDTKKASGYEYPSTGTTDVTGSGASVYDTTGQYGALLSNRTRTAYHPYTR